MNREGEAAGADARAEREALRLCDRYVSEVVLAFGLCPWAEPALRAGRVGRVVCLEAAPTPEACLGYFEQFAAAVAPSLDIGLLVFPRYGGGWVAFDGFAERVRRADAQRRAGAGPSTEFLVAAFHPDGAEIFSGPHQLVSFLRRTPDPTLQLVRAELIDRLRQTQGPALEAVGTRNHETLVGAGIEPGRLEALQRTIHAIRADRDSTYARLAAGDRAVTD